MPLDATADSIKRHFEKFGVINDILMVRNNKFAYLTFSRSSEAALALEGCDRCNFFKDYRLNSVFASLLLLNRAVSCNFYEGLQTFAFI